MERFYMTLFEVSNDYRHSILLLLKEKPMKIMEISKKLELTTQEISRHISRLTESGLVAKDVEGFHHLTNYGKLIHVLLEEFEFVSKYRDYFIDHSVLDLDLEFVKRLGDLSGSRYVNNTMEFLHFVDRLIKESKESVWLQVDQYPLTSIGSIIDGLKRGVKFRVLEQSEVLSGPRVNLETLEEAEAIIKTRNTAQSEQRTLNENGVFMFISDDRCAVAFPTKGALFDYKGFTASDKRSIKWCSDLFNYNWGKISLRQTPSGDAHEYRPSPVSVRMEKGVAVIDGQNLSIDAQNVQYAVDHYDEILLKGVFDFGASTIKVTKSVKIRGEKEADSPTTKIFKRGWSFPLVNFDSVFEVDGKNIDVSIEDIHFTDFDGSCINGRRARSLKILNNRMTLETGYGRGWKYHQYGDFVTGIWLDTPLDLTKSEKNFVNGVLVEGNYLDFEEARIDATLEKSPNESSVGFLSETKATGHEYYQGMGIHINNLSCRVDVKRNIIRNMNARGISIADNFTEAKISVADNVIHSEIPGSYPYHGVEAGIGIFAQASFLHQRPGFKIDIHGNSIRLEKPDYCGVVALNSTQTDAKSDSVLSGSIAKNKIHLDDGRAGVKVGSEDLEVLKNILTGGAFFGIIKSTAGLPGSLTANEENDKIKDNDLSSFEIIDPRRWVSRRWPV
jgi:predicted transcriptional regulator